MWISDLALSDFRSHQQVVLRPGAGVVSLVGPNGVGKTNIVEAVGYLSSLTSHRVAADLPLVRQGAEQAVVKAKVVREDRAIAVGLEIKASGSNRAWLGRAPARRLQDVLGLVKAVTFAPEDLALVKGGPETRRAFMDWLVVQHRPAFLGPLRDLDKVTRQRGALLKSLAPLRGAAKTNALTALEVWNEKAADLGAQVTLKRASVLSQLSQHLDRIYPAFAPQDHSATASYQPAVPLTGQDDLARVRLALLDQQKQLLDKEIQRGVNLVGPQRDELALTIHGRPARGYASHGEAWSLALALRLASWELIRDLQVGDPILVLDDVFAELDSGRRERLVELASQVEQVWVTAAVESDVPTQLSGQRFCLDRQGFVHEC